MISDLKLVSGPPELTKAAWEAVKQWTYKPYLLNGDPVAVETTITVTFALAQSSTPSAPSQPIHPASNAQSAAAPSQAMHMGGNIKPPVLIRQVEPEYSQQARLAKYSGTVQVYLLVDKNGHPPNLRVVKGVGMGLDEKAIEAVRQYQFKPATLAWKASSRRPLH